MYSYSIKYDATQILIASGTAHAYKYDDELDNIISILADICDALDESNAVTFCVEGFGQSPWPVDVRTDLLVFLEQLPSFAAWISQDNVPGYVLDFFEQGIERTLTFEHQVGIVHISCDSRTKWKPDPVVETVTIDKLRSMQRDFWDSFSRLANAMDASLTTHPWFRAWAETVSL